MIKWQTVSEFIDIDTGELLTKIHKKEQLKYTNYVLVSTSKKTEQNDTTRIIRITNMCRHTGQREIIFK